MLYRIAVLALAAGLVATSLGAGPVRAAPLEAASVVVQIDNPSPNEQPMAPNWIAGWAVDTAATGGPGIESVAIYVDGDMISGRLLGHATYGADRIDVAQQYGNPAFRYSGFTFSLAGTNVSVGPAHSFTVVAKSAFNNGVATAATVSGVTLAPMAPPYAVQPNAIPAYGPAGAYGQPPNAYPGQAVIAHPAPYYGSASYGSAYSPYYGSGYNSGVYSPYYGSGYNSVGYAPYYGGGYNTGAYSPYYGTGYNGSVSGFSYGSSYNSFYGTSYSPYYGSGYHGSGYYSAFRPYRGNLYGSYYYPAWYRYGYPGHGTPFTR